MKAISAVLRRLTAGLLAGVCAISTLSLLPLSPAAASSITAANSVAEVSALVRDAWDTHTDTLILSDAQIKTEDCKALLEGLFLTYGIYFYVNSSYSIKYNYSGIVNSLTFSYNCTEAEMQTKRAAYTAAVKKAVSGVRSDWSDSEKALYLHDYLICRTKYDQVTDRYTAYDALVDGTALCQGYALAYHDLLEAVGISSHMVTSEALNHCWNLVCIDGKAYHTDVTWDDRTPELTGNCKHEHFLCSAQTFLAGAHNSSDWNIVLADDSLPAADSNSYETAFWRQSEAPLCYTDFGWAAVVPGNPTGADIVLADSIAAKTTKTIFSFEAYWTVHNNDTSYWKGVFSGCGYYGGRIYFSTPTAIFSIAPDGSDKTTVYTCTASEQKLGWLYGFYIEPDGLLRYGISTAPDSVSQNDSIQLKITKPKLPPYSRGDMTGDGVIDLADAIAVLRYYAASLLGKPPVVSDEALAAGDVDAAADTPQLDTKDAILILRYYAMSLLSPNVKWDMIC